MAEAPTQTKWHMTGPYIKNCSCAPGCPCDFNSDPTHHYCTGMAGQQIKDGAFGDTSLSGLKWAATYHWPGPLHEGNGTLQPFVDADASPAQRDAILQILSGQNGGTFFEILAAIVTTFHEPQFVPIEFDFDQAKRTAHMRIDGQFVTESQPIRNPVTGEEYHVLVQMREGFEYRLAEIGQLTVNRSDGAIKFDTPGGHSSLAVSTFTNQ
jgi:hypothetical protein